MTLTTLITVNAVLGSVTLYGLLHLLAHGIHSDRSHPGRVVAEVRALPQREARRTAA